MESMRYRGMKNVAIGPVVCGGERYTKMSDRIERQNRNREKFGARQQQSSSYGSLMICSIALLLLVALPFLDRYYKAK